jgi:hypothetical protein
MDNEKRPYLAGIRLVYGIAGGVHERVDATEPSEDIPIDFVTGQVPDGEEGVAQVRLGMAHDEARGGVRRRE